MSTRKAVKRPPKVDDAPSGATAKTRKKATVDVNVPPISGVKNDPERRLERRKKDHEYGEGKLINPKYPGGVIMEAILAGQSNDEAWATVKAKFPELPDAKYGYVQWCRAYLKRTGVMR
jgi:hypothetical protein